MIAFLRSRRCRLPLAVILLLATQIAFAGQACRTVMPGSSSTDAGAAMHRMQGATGGAMAGIDARPCCEKPAAPITTCLVPDDASSANALVTNTELPRVTAPVAVAFTAALHGANAAASRPAHSAAGPPLRTYIVYHRFLS